MLKVTFCIYDKPDSVGGPVTWVQTLLPALRQRNIDVRCLFLLHWGDTGPALSSLRDQGFDFRAVLAQDRTEDRVRWILEQLRDDPPDVFVPNLVVAGYHAARWVREAGIPTIGVLHSDDDYYRALLDEFVFGARKFRLSGIVCVSRELERQVQQQHPSDTLVRRIPYGVQVAAPHPRNGDRLKLVFAGRFAEEQKRISDVAHALCRAVREVPGTEAVLYGDGPDRAAVERIVLTAGAGLPISLGGLVPSDAIQERFLDGDVIVLLSDYEGLPIALMEAMACGCIPVCLRMRSGIAELVEDGVTGLLVNNRDDDFVRAIQSLRADPALCERLSAAARERIAGTFSADSCASAWTSLLLEMRGRRKPRRPVRIPGSLRLAPANIHLESPDYRRRLPSLPVRALRRGRIFAGRVRRTLLGPPIHDETS